MVAAGIVLSIISWKCRKFANCLIFYEFLLILLDSCLMTEPQYAFGQKKGYLLHYKCQMTSVRFTLAVICLGCESRSSIISATLLSALAQFLVLPLVYQHASNARFAIDQLGLVLLVFLLTTAFWMLLRKVARLQHGLHASQREHDALIVQYGGDRASAQARLITNLDVD